MLKSLIIGCTLLLMVQDVPKQLWKVPVKKYTFYTTSPTGEVYVVKGHEIILFKNQQEKYRYSNKQLGDIYSIDCGNSLRLLVYYRDMNEIVILDNTLSQHGQTIHLESEELQQVTLAATSNNNTLWLYNTDNFELMRVDRDLQILSRSGNLGQLLNQELEPNYLQESGDYVYLNDPDIGILVFDRFGSYYKTIPVKALNRFQVIGDEKLCYMTKDSVYVHNLKFMRTAKKAVPGAGATDVRLLGTNFNQMMVAYPDSLVLFERTQ